LGYDIHTHLKKSPGLKLPSNTFESRLTLAEWYLEAEMNENSLLISL